MACTSKVLPSSVRTGPSTEPLPDIIIPTVEDEPTIILNFPKQHSDDYSMVEIGSLFSNQANSRQIFLREILTSILLRLEYNLILDGYDSQDILDMLSTDLSGEAQTNICNCVNQGKRTIDIMDVLQELTEDDVVAYIKTVKNPSALHNCIINAKWPFSKNPKVLLAIAENPYLSDGCITSMLARKELLNSEIYLQFIKAQNNIQIFIDQTIVLLMAKGASKAESIEIIFDAIAENKSLKYTNIIDRLLAIKALHPLSPINCFKLINKIRARNELPPLTLRELILDQEISENTLELVRIAFFRKLTLDNLCTLVRHKNFQKIKLLNIIETLKKEGSGIIKENEKGLDETIAAIIEAFAQNPNIYSNDAMLFKHNRIMTPEEQTFLAEKIAEKERLQRITMLEEVREQNITNERLVQIFNSRSIDLEIISAILDNKNLNITYDHTISSCNISLNVLLAKIEYCTKNNDIRSKELRDQCLEKLISKTIDHQDTTSDNIICHQIFNHFTLRDITFAQRLAIINRVRSRFELEPLGTLDLVHHVHMMAKLPNNNIIKLLITTSEEFTPEIALAIAKSERFVSLSRFLLSRISKLPEFYPHIDEIFAAFVANKKTSYNDIIELFTILENIKTENGIEISALEHRAEILETIRARNECALFEKIKKLENLGADLIAMVENNKNILSNRIIETVIRHPNFNPVYIDRIIGALNFQTFEDINRIIEIFIDTGKVNGDNIREILQNVAHLTKEQKKAIIHMVQTREQLEKFNQELAGLGENQKSKYLADNIQFATLPIILTAVENGHCNGFNVPKILERLEELPDVKHGVITRDEALDRILDSFMLINPNTTAATARLYFAKAPEDIKTLAMTKASKMPANKSRGTGQTI